ncbi:glycosyltransferase family 4 protein [Winogradskyella aquimaris]|uniref:Glycosyltransferase family 4 protein n=1 Tax=Winogradskyella aquimaris TaxID=864074 RepID=A0ABU5EQV7_9FLAO|nr:glycosyltransferase family 4 protein [Winogradskyella aquimaris]MDY2587159.1 glycosyltransferase family 4 protein [Winogradskyella aquimaris]
MKNKRTKFLVVTYTPLIKKEGEYYSYSPYVDEMDMWFSFADEYRILSPDSYPTDFLSKPFQSKNIKGYRIPFIAFNSFSRIIKGIVLLPFVIFQIFRAMFWANHIHFRSPGNITLIGAVVQIFFPFKKKSVKYAGNWDPNSKQPLSYRVQKAIFRNTILSKNINVLVYGEWPNETSNVVPFMSATYRESEKQPFKHRDFNGRLKFVFIGAMVVGKRPKLTVQIVQKLLDNGIDAELHMFGDGDLIEEIRELVKHYNLQDRIHIYGNRDKSEIKQCLLDAHFSILPSKSEGWPKAIAEGMFFGAIPISTKISCLPWILDYGKRGILIDEDLNEAFSVILNELRKGNDYLNTMSKKAQDWAQQYTLDRLEQEIKKVVIGD